MDSAQFIALSDGIFEKIFSYCSWFTMLQCSLCSFYSC